MKRAFAALLALIMAISLVGCSEKDQQNPNIEANAGAISPDKEAEETISGKTEEVWKVVSETNTSSSGYETTTEYAYNLDGSYSMDSSQDGYFEFDANGNEVLFKNYFVVRTTTYDENGNKIAEETESSEGSKEKHEYKYDDQGNCIEELFYKNDGSVSTQILRDYDSNGNLTREETITPDYTYAEEFIYDEHNNFTCQRNYEDGEFKKEIFHDYTYDEAGNMLMHIQHGYNGSKAIETLTYNEQGLVISEKIGNELSNDSKRNIVYEYDENGNLIYMKSMNDIDLIKIEKYYQYDNNGNLIYEKWTHENSFMEDERDQVQEWVYTYDEHGNLIQMDYTKKHDADFFERTVWEYELISFSR